MNQLPQKTTGVLRVLHTSDWHLGKRLYHQNRYEEFEAFLAWLSDKISEHCVDVLIVAGDIFDTMTPSNQAQALYYQFLAKICQSSCQHIIITAGNHDSPAFLEAPKHLLHTLNIQVIGAISDHIHDEQLILYQQNQPVAIVLAVPYLRDKDIRSSQFYDNNRDKERQTTQGIAQHYQKLASLAKDTQKCLEVTHQCAIPIIATGHLFVAGCQTSAIDDGMRELYVGTLGQVSSAIFAKDFDYVALGHIHAPQKVANQAHIRYCGSPIAMGFGEIGKEKQVLIVDFNGRTPSVHTLSVPVFQQLARIKGDWQYIQNALHTLIAQQKSVWTEIIYDGQTLQPNLVKNIHQLLADTNVQALSIQNKLPRQSSLGQTSDAHLKNLSPIEVFKRLLAQENSDTHEKNDLLLAYRQLLVLLHETDNPS